MKPTWYRLIRRHADNEAYLVTDRRQLEVVRARAAELTARNAMLLRLDVQKLASGAWSWEWIVDGKSASLAFGRTWISEEAAGAQARLKDLRGLVTWPELCRVTRIADDRWVLHYPEFWHRDPKVRFDRDGKTLVEVDAPKNTSWVASVNEPRLIAAAKALKVGESTEVTV